MNMKLSVMMITYNHERFIGQAIESVVSQRTNFPIELVIGEDVSKDGTRAIVERYARAYPEIIRPILREKNVGMNHNFFGTYFECRGEYVASLAGDDYWTDPCKLQKQVDALDANPDWAICYHKVRCFYEDGSQEPHIFPEKTPKRVSTLDDLLEDNFISDCSCVFRNGLIKSLPEWVYGAPVGDYILHIFNAQHGQIGFIDEVMAAYRKHAGGAWSLVDPLQKRVLWAEMQRNLVAHVSPRHRRILLEKSFAHMAGAAEKYAARGEKQAARGCLRQIAKRDWHSPLLPRRRLLRLWLSVDAPRLLRLVQALRARK